MIQLSNEQMIIVKGGGENSVNDDKRHPRPGGGVSTSSVIRLMNELVKHI